jgi:hypothetical protein
MAIRCGRTRVWANTRFAPTRRAPRCLHGDSLRVDTPVRPDPWWHCPVAVRGDSLRANTRFAPTHGGIAPPPCLHRQSPRTGEPMCPPALRRVAASHTRAASPAMWSNAHMAAPGCPDPDVARRCDVGGPQQRAIAPSGGGSVAAAPRRGRGRVAAWHCRALPLSATRSRFAPPARARGNAFPLATPFPAPAIRTGTNNSVPPTPGQDTERV